MSVPPISSIATDDTKIDLDATFGESLSIARNVVKGVLLKTWEMSYEGHDICLAAQRIIEGDERYSEALTMRDPQPADVDGRRFIQLPRSGDTISTHQWSRNGQTGGSHSYMNRDYPHFRSGNSLQTFNNSNFPQQSSLSSFNVAQAEPPQLGNSLQPANNYSQRSYPSMSRHYLHSLSSNQQQPQLRPASSGVEYPRKLEQLFPRSDSILATQTTNATNRSNVQQQIIARLQQDPRNFANSPYPYNQATYRGQGLSSNLAARSSSNGSLPPNTSSLPVLAPAQKYPPAEDLLTVESRSTTQSRSETPMDFEMSQNTIPKKRRAQTDKQKAAKRAKANESEKANKLELMKDKAKYNIPVQVWWRILEFCPPIFLRKARLINKEWAGWVKNFSSIHDNNRKENFGYNLPEHIPGLSGPAYLDLLGGKGCMEPGCKNKDATRAHWAWKKRWCFNCWKEKIEREDRIQKHRQLQYTRATIDQLLACIPVSMYDSFGKPHDYVEDEAQPQANQASTHRLYKYYLIADVENIIKEYEALTPEPYREDPTHDAQQKVVARQIYDEKMLKLPEEQTKFCDEKKAENQKLMQLVLQIEKAIKERREKTRKPNDANRKARRKLFLESAKRDLPEIPEEFVLTTKAFKDATRIFRDPGSERGWRTLMPKILAEYEASKKKDQKAANPASNATSNTTSEAKTDEDVQMSGNELGNFGLNNENASQLSIQGPQQNAQQSQLQGYQVQKPMASTSKSSNMNHSMLGYGSGLNPPEARRSNNTSLPPMNFPANRPLMHSTSSLNNTISTSTSPSKSRSNQGASAGSMARFAQNNNGPAAISMNYSSLNNNGSSIGSSNVSRATNTSNSSLPSHLQGNSGSSVNSSGSGTHSNNFSSSLLPPISQNSNGTASSVMRGFNLPTFNSASLGYDNSSALGLLSQRSNGSSLLPGHLSSYSSQNNNASSLNSLSYIAQNNDSSSVTSTNSSQNYNTFFNSSNHPVQNNNSSSVASTNSSNVGSSSAPRTSISINSILDGPTSQGN